MVAFIRSRCHSRKSIVAVTIPFQYFAFLYRLAHSSIHDRQIQILSLHSALNLFGYDDVMWIIKTQQRYNGFSQEKLKNGYFVCAIQRFEKTDGIYVFTIKYAGKLNFFNTQYQPKILYDSFNYFYSKRRVFILDSFIRVNPRKSVRKYKNDVIWDDTMYAQLMTQSLRVACNDPSIHSFRPSAARSLAPLFISCDKWKSSRSISLSHLEAFSSFCHSKYATVSFSPLHSWYKRRVSTTENLSRYCYASSISYSRHSDSSFRSFR